MIINPNFNFSINVSRDHYEKKTDATACLCVAGAKVIGKKKMAFDEKTVTTDEFLTLATTGHCFCQLFKPDPNQEYWMENKSGKKIKSKPYYAKGANKGAMKVAFKSDQFFRGAQVIFVDIDYTRYTNIPAYISALTYKPTCTYLSFSDAIDKHGVVSRRFRLVYVFDTIMDKEQFCGISRGLTDQIIKDTNEAMDDDCGCRPSQYMNGVYGKQEIYASYCIYNVSDIPSIDASEKESTIAEEQPEVSPLFNEQMLADMASMSYTDFMHYYSLQYRYIYRSESSDWTDGLYQETGEDYLQLWYFRDKVQDGEHRRRKLFKNACLRRLMSPEMDANTLLFNLYVDLVRFFDNSDGVITLDCLKRKVKHAIKMSLDDLKEYCGYELRYWQSNKPSFIFKPGMTKSVIRTKLRDIRYSGISAVYDEKLSVQENIKAGVDVPERTLYRYCELMGIKTDPHKVDQKIFQEVYDPKLSQRQNLKVFAGKGYRISLGKISQMARQSTQTQEQTVEIGVKPNWHIPKIEIDEWVMPTLTMPEMPKTSQTPSIPFEWEPPVFNFCI